MKKMLMTPQWILQILARSGPPDLDQLFLNLRRRFAGLLGGAPTPPGKERDPSQNIKMAGLIIASVFVLWLLSGFYKVDVPEEAVVTRFGRYVYTKSPGLNWRLPYPIENAQIVNVSQVRTIEIGYRGDQRTPIVAEAEMITEEENIVSVQFAVQYLIKDPVKFLFVGRSPEESVRQAAESAIREWVGKSKIDFVLYEGRSEIAASTLALLQEILDRYGTGILIHNVTMQNIQPPAKVQDAFDDAVRAVQDRDRQRSEGEAYANNVVPRAKGTAARLVAEASGYSQSIVANAEGESNRFTQVLKAYAKAPQVTRERMYLETLEKIYSQHQKILLDSQKPGNLFVLPLDKILAGNQASAKEESASALSNGEPATLPTQEPSTAPSAAMNAQDRGADMQDLLRLRDRNSRP